MADARERCHSDSGLGISLSLSSRGGDALCAPCFVDNALENSYDRFGLERPREIRCGLPDLFQHLLLTLGLVDWHTRVVLQPADFERAGDANVQQPHQLIVDNVDPVSQVVDFCQDFSHRTYSATRFVRSGFVPASAIT